MLVFLANHAVDSFLTLCLAVTFSLRQLSPKKKKFLPFWVTGGVNVTK